MFSKKEEEKLGAWKNFKFFGGLFNGSWRLILRWEIVEGKKSKDCENDFPRERISREGGKFLICWLKEFPKSKKDKERGRLSTGWLKCPEMINFLREEGRWTTFSEYIGPFKEREMREEGRLSTGPSKYPENFFKFFGRWSTEFVNNGFSIFKCVREEGR